VLDENGGLLLAPQALCDALRDKRWQELFVAGVRCGQALPAIGHALLEKLVQPRKAITAHVICVPLEQAPRLASLAEADGWLDDQLRTQSCNLASKPYLPIPILGIPDWCLQNQNFSFYDDSLVFRAPRTVQTTQQQVLPERELAVILALHRRCLRVLVILSPVWSTPSMKRIALFLLTNIAVVAVLGIVASLLGVNRYLTANGLNLGALLGFAFIMGFGGAIISLLISKPMAKWSIGRAGHQRAAQRR
jgi:hypothetical protein